MSRPARTATAVAVLVLALTACSPDGGGTSEGARVSGDRLVRIGIASSPTDTLDLTQATTSLPWAVDLNVFDSLALLDGDSIRLQLAESVTPDETATAWTIVIRDGVSFSDGSPVTADDVLYSLQYLAESPNFALMYGAVDWGASTSDGDRTVVLAMRAPSAGFLDEAIALASIVFPEGTVDFSSPIGSGPYTVESFSPDTGAVLRANPGYWDGSPEIDEVQLVPITDPATRMSAVQDGQLELAVGVSATGAASVAEDAGLEVIDGGAANSTALSFVLNASTPPFDDPEVRVAFKQVVDREQLVDVVLHGRGEVGNDVQGLGLAGYDTTLEQRETDVESARAVFEEKGISTLEILASETVPGMLDAVRLLQQQLADVGVTLVVDERDASTLYSDLDAIYASPIFASYLINRPFASGVSLYTDPASPYNFGQWDDADYTAALRDSAQITDPDAREAALAGLQQRIWADGAEVVWGFQPVLSVAAADLSGVTFSQSVPLLVDAVLGS